MKLVPGWVWLGASAAAVITVLMAGVILLGSPMDERARRIDRRRVSDLQGITAATDLYWTRHSKLPVSLDELTAEPGVKISTRDPGSSEIYSYQPSDSTHYELCASFERESGEISGNSASAAQNLWTHGSGRQCFQLGAEEIARTPAPRAARRDGGHCERSVVLGMAARERGAESGTTAVRVDPDGAACTMSLQDGSVRFQ